jgi:hypothetical protein
MRTGAGVHALGSTAYVPGAVVVTPRAAIKLFDAQNALVGHRLCENTDGLLEEQGLASWRIGRQRSMTSFV